MDADRWREVRTLFEAAIDLPEDLRRAFLLGIADDDVRADVERLLARHAQDTAPIDRPAAALVQTALGEPRNWDQDQVGRRIGPFVLTSLLGAGGMGSVYRAERRDGSFDQVVAIKLVLSALPGLRERFRREQAVLATLRHPGIASLIDGGETDDGIPYLVMDFVDGVPLTDYCREHLPEARERLMIVRDVALALADAHRHLIVHRDIKPNNILVERTSGHPMLLDFGIAKLIGEDGIELTAQRIGPMTPAFAAPEQFLGQPVSVATDVYQLGVLLFRLLAGRMPFLGEDTLALSRAVLEGAIPSLETTQRGEHDGEGVRTLPRALARDLDALLRKAMATDAADRYGSMDALVADIDAVLDQRPLQARRGQRLYPLRQFLRRHRLGLAAGSAALLALLGATGMALYQAHQAIAESERARVSVDFMRELFKSADPNVGRAPNATVLELIDLASAELDRRFAEHADLRGPLAAQLASAYSSFGAMDRALPMARRAIADLDAITSDGLVLAAALENGAWIAHRNGERELSDTWSQRAEALIGDAGDAESVRIREGLFLIRWSVARDSGRYQEALDIAEANMHNAARAPADIRDGTQARALNRRGTILTDMGQYARAEQDLTTAAALAEKQFGRDDYRTLRLRMVVAWHYAESGQAQRGFEMLQALRPMLEKVFGARSQTLAALHYNLGNAQRELGRYDAASASYLQSVAIHEASGARNTSQIGWALWNAAGAEMKAGNLDRAEELLDEVERRWEGAIAPDAPVRAELAQTRKSLAALRDGTTGPSPDPAVSPARPAASSAR